MTHDDIFVHFIKMPPGANEIVSPNEDGSYSIFINKNLCEGKRIDSYYHAVNHIKNMDFQQSNVQEIEVKAHYVTSSMEKSIKSNVYEKKIQALRNKREKNKKKRRQLEKTKINFMHKYGDLFLAAENQWLYKDDL